MLSNNSNERNSYNGNKPQEIDLTSPDSLDVDFSDYWVKLKRRWKPALAIFLATVGTTALLSTFLEKNYRAEGQLLFKQKSAASLTGVGKDVGNLTPLLNTQSPLSTQIEVITSDPVLQAAIDRLKLQDNEGQPLKPKDLEKKLKIDLVGGSDVININYKDKDPKVAANVVNTLMDVYMNEQIRSNQSEPATAREFINKQIPPLETKVSEAESNLQKFRTENNIVDLKEEKRTLVNDLGTLNQTIATSSAELQGVQTQTAALQSQLGLDLNQAISAKQLSGTPEVQAILGELTDAETQLAKERQRFKDNHPSIVSINDKKTELRGQLEGLIRQKVGASVSEGLLQNSDGVKENQLEKFINLKIDELSARQQVLGLYQSQQEYLKRAKQLPQLEKKEQELIRQVETTNKTYKTLLDSLQELELAENQQSGNAKIVELASIPDKGSSGKLPLMALGVLLGLLFSNLSVILLEMQDRTLKTIAEIKQRFSYSILGVVPLDSFSGQSQIIVRDEPDSFTSEVYRMIQANLKFLTSQKPPKVILVTSSVPEEGKSNVSANLAAAIAQLGRRVLLIDGDLRRASQHTLWQVTNRSGLREAIEDNLPLSKIVAKPMNNLDLLLAGKISSNPLAILDSVEMSQLVARARQNYDVVLIDAPPLPVTADVLTLSKLVDGIVFVSRPGVVERESAQLAQETLGTSGQKVLGMVINAVKSNEFDRYSYHAKYGKRYFNRQSAGNSNNGSTNEASRI
jgi:capsular exopolysaccharide synthesis family protein